MSKPSQATINLFGGLLLSDRGEVLFALANRADLIHNNGQALNFASEFYCNHESETMYAIGQLMTESISEDMWTRAVVTKNHDLLDALLTAHHTFDCAIPQKHAEAILTMMVYTHNEKLQDCLNCSLFDETLDLQAKLLCDSIEGGHLFIATKLIRSLTNQDYDFGLLDEAKQFKEIAKLYSIVNHGASLT